MANADFVAAPEEGGGVHDDRRRCGGIAGAIHDLAVAGPSVFDMAGIVLRLSRNASAISCEVPICRDGHWMSSNRSGR